jgi:predicted Zn-dependent peptidase
MYLINNEGLGDWREINAAGKKIQAVTASDVKRVANQYLYEQNRSVATYTRKGAKAQKAVANTEVKK